MILITRAFSRARRPPVFAFVGKVSTYWKEIVLGFAAVRRRFGPKDVGLKATADRGVALEGAENI